MISTFDVFKIILGVIISAFILVLVFRFAGSYVEIGESGKVASSFVSFKKTMDNVYAGGVPEDFDFRDTEVILGYRPPNIETPLSYYDSGSIPLILVPGQKLAVYRGEYDTGWWKFYFIEALPETKILFVPVSGSENAWSVVRSVTELMPSTENIETSVAFGVGCNGTDFWFDPNWEKTKFLNSVLRSFSNYAAAEGFSMNQCENTAYFRDKGFRVVTIAENKEDAKQAEFLVVPTDEGYGHVYVMNGVEENEYTYDNAFEIIALMMGGEEFYRYASAQFLEELKVATNVFSEEYSILLSSSTNFNQRCQGVATKFMTAVDSVNTMIPELEDGATEEELGRFSLMMKEAGEQYREIERTGCA